MSGGLYACNPKLIQKEHQNKISTSIQNHLTVKEKTQFISNRQLKRAQDVKRLQNALGMSSYKDLRAIIIMNLIKDNQISHDDINLAEIVFGKSMGEIKGKTTLQTNNINQIGFLSPFV